MEPPDAAPDSPFIHLVPWYGAHRPEAVDWQIPKEVTEGECASPTSQSRRGNLFHLSSPAERGKKVEVEYVQTFIAVS